MTPCRNGGHLWNCLVFECLNTFKCQFAYCVPWNYVCDGKWDCSHGEDEKYAPVCGNDAICRNLFRCHNTTNTCLHLANLCDNNVDCAFGDDELLCSLKGIQCPESCLCVAFVISCSNRFLMFSKIYPFLYTIIQDSSSTDSYESFFDSFSQSFFYSMISVNMTDICHKRYNKEAVYFDLQKNCLTDLAKGCFGGLTRLKILILANNYISLLDTFSFVGLPQLVLLNLSNNPLDVIREQFLSDCPKIAVFSFNQSSDNVISNIHLKAFGDVQVSYVLTNNFHLCCVVSSGSHCTSLPPWYTSCSD